ncbi:hypothetical protein LTR93_007869 [Exophiala xenobiotica]|nr:hypothetical protein LTR93_007869 [Exophiala xenobiotica]
MSYPPISSFGDYYETANQGQNMQHSYNTARQSNDRYTTQAPYSGDIRQNQYGSSGYDWSGQNQQNYTDSSRQQTYNTSSWKDERTQGAPYGDTRQTSNYETQSSADSNRQEHYNARSTTQSTQGLNNLAYASGLQDSGSQRQGHRPQQASMSLNSTYAAGNAPNRVQSPVAQQGARRYSSNQSTNHTNQNEAASTSNQQPQMPAAAAAALAGAVNRRFPQASSTQASVSPVLNGANAPSAVPQRTTSPYFQSNLPPPQRKPSSHAQQTAHSATANTPRGTVQQASQNQSGKHIRTPSQGMQQSSDQPQQQVPQVNSISNLVTHSSEEPPQTQYSATTNSQNTMPSYIDPAQVFNPYAREHERRRKEAEAEAKRKAEEEVAAARRREEEAAATKRREEEEDAARKKQGEAAVATTAKASKKRSRTKASKPPQAQGGAEKPSALPEANTEPTEKDMAAELKAMMDKMKEFRTQDPSLFQKLWDDMRKVTVPVQPPSPAMAQATRSPPPPMPHTPLTAPSTASTVQQQSSAAQPSPARRRRAAPSHPHSNGYKVVVEDNAEGLPDLGRFPAERRMRASYNTSKRASKSARATPEATRNAPPPHAIPQQTAIPPPRAISQQTAIPPPRPADQQQVPPSLPPALPPQTSAAAAKDSVLKSPQLTQGLPPRGAHGMTVWPEERRNALAEAAVKALKSYPGNQSIEITPADIHAILEKNPSYMDLCEILEAKGFKYHRGQFARQLLSNVPNLNGPQPKPSPSQPQAQLQASALNHPPPPPAPVLLDASRAPAAASIQPPMPGPVLQPSGARNPSVPALSGPPANAAIPPGTPMVAPPQFRTQNGAVFSGHPPAKPTVYFQAPHTQSNMRVPRPNSFNVINPSRSEPPQGTKEAQARKRDFSEIVDLTALNDDEDYVLSRKQARVESPSPEPDPFEEYQRKMTAVPQPPVILPSQGPPPGWPYTTADGTPLKFNPNDGRQYAPRPTAMVPTQAPPPTTLKTNKILAKPIKKDEALRKNYYNPKTVARDILIAAGRHPIERPLNAHMAGLLGKHIDLDSDLSTFDWDAIDPGGPPVPQVAFVDVPTEPPRYQLGQMVVRRNVEKAQESRLPKPDKREMHALGDTTSTREEQRFTLPHSHKQLNGHSRSSIVAQSPLRQDVPSESSLKRRKSNTSVTSLPPDPTRDRSTRSISINVRHSVEGDKVQTMQPGSLYPSGKRRGRPPGAKNIHAGVRALKAAADPAQISVTVSSQSSLPQFKCRWKGCKAHLHNLDTLRQHIVKVHQPTQEDVDQFGYICWWKRCQYLEDDGKGGIGPSKTFDNMTAWLGHVEEDHLYQLAMKLGDGPSTKYIDPQTVLQDRSRYLSDESGRMTTPTSSTKAQDDLERDTMTLTKADPDDHERTAQRSFMKTHRKEAKSSPKALAEETLRAMTARKAEIGPGLERAGAILVNEERRKTLIQNEDLDKVLDPDF